MLQCSLPHRFWAGAIAISSLCAHNAFFLLMALPEGPSPKAFWTDFETWELININFLYDKRLEGDGARNFKQHTYNAAAEHIAQHLSQGPIKTAAMCRIKWTMVFSKFFCFLIILSRCSSPCYCCLVEVNLYCY